MSVSNMPKWYYIIAINSYFFHLALVSWFIQIAMNIFSWFLLSTTLDSMMCIIHTWPPHPQKKTLKSSQASSYHKQHSDWHPHRFWNKDDQTTCQYLFLFLKELNHSSKITAV